MKISIDVFNYYIYNNYYYWDYTNILTGVTKEEIKKMPKNEEIENKNNILNVKNISQKIIHSDTNESVTKTKKSEKNVDENLVIEKIKNFLTKIIAMQEEEIEKEKKNKVKSKSVDKKAKKEYMMEYYDLPYRYNETIVKILAQTPKKLFVYWDISDNDRKRYVETFGDKFFEMTYPVLLVYNEDKKYVKEVAINDFANSWYIDIDDPKNKYTIQLGRKFINAVENLDNEKLIENNIELQTDYLPLANSNVLEVPNDHVLLEFLPNFVTFRNVKTNEEYTKDLRTFKNVYGKNYNVEEFYQNQYSDEIADGMFDMKNPSSKISSSTFK